MTAAIVPNTTDWYIEQIVDLMCRGAWVRGASRRKLAKDWGVPVSTVANFATMASKIVKSGTDDEVRDEIKAVTIERLQIVAAKAEGEKKYGDAIKASRVLNEITGAIGAQSPARIALVVLGVQATPDRLKTMLEDAMAFLAERYPEAAAALAAHLTGSSGSVVEMVVASGGPET